MLNVRAHPAGDVPGSRTHPIDKSSSSTAVREQPDLVTHNVTLESHELFTQLSITAALVQTGPRRGVFLSCIDVIEKRTPRVWREWLAERAGKETSQSPAGGHNDLDDQSNSIVWADQGKTLGLKVRVKQKMWRRDAPILIHRDEDQVVSYSLELEGKNSFARRNPRRTGACDTGSDDTLFVAVLRSILTQYRALDQHNTSSSGRRKVIVGEA